METNLDDGRKKLTGRNWLEPDEASTVLVAFQPEERTLRKLTEEDWAKRFLGVTLSGAVPAEVSDLFDVARGALLYGYFYYPMYALGEDQLFRVADSALLHKYLHEGGRMASSTRQPTCGEKEPEVREEAPPFGARVRFLVAHGLLSEREAEWWECTWDLRNLTTHVKFSRLGPPTQALGTLRRVARHINALFGESIP